MEIIATVAATLGVGTLLKTLLDYWIESRKKKAEQETAFTEVFKAIHEVYFVLLTVIRRSAASRAAVVKTTNGGGRPTLTGKLYSSVVYEAFEQPLESTKDGWQNQLLDQAYLEMLYEMNKTGRLVIDTEAMQPGVLRDLYERLGVSQSWIFRLVEREDEYLYFVVNFAKPERPSAEINELFRSSVTQLTNLFTKNRTI